MPRVFILILSVFALNLFLLSGCMSSADEELSKAEEMLDEALDHGADELAADDYRAAQQYFEEAMESMKDERPADARAAAKKSQLRAEDALLRVKKHQDMLEDEAGRLGN